MPVDRINHPAALVAALAYFLWGAVWYTVFGAQWLALIGGKTPGQGAAGYVVGLAMALVLAYATAIALSHDEQRTAAHGAQFGVFMGLAFVVSNMLTGFMFEGRPLALWLLNSGYVVIGMALVGAIVGAWKKRT